MLYGHTYKGVIYCKVQGDLIICGLDFVDLDLRGWPCIILTQCCATPGLPSRIGHSVKIYQSAKISLMTERMAALVQ